MKNIQNNNYNGNKFQAGVEATRKQIEVIEAEKVAKEIKQYGGLDVYNLMKAGQMYAIVVDGIVVGGAVSEEDAAAAIEFLQHFTGGSTLCGSNVFDAGMRSMAALTKANDLIEAEKGGIKIEDTLVVNGGEYVIDDTKELYTIDGEHVGNVADIVEAKASGALSEELFMEIIGHRIADWKAEQEDDEEY